MRRDLAPSAALCALFPLLVGAPAFAQPAHAPPPLAAPDPASAAFDALPETDRKALQEALVWTGDYQGVVDGAIGRRSREAFLAFDRKNSPAADGLPTPSKLKALFAAAARARQAAGFVVVADPTGARIGVPKTLLPQATRTPGASRYASKDGRVTLDLAVVDSPDMDLPRLFDRLKTESPTRRVTYKLARPDFVVVAGETQGRKFYTRFGAGLDGQGRPALRGFSFYFPAERGDLDRLTIAVANSFEPFPGAAPVPEPPPRADATRPPVPAVQTPAPASALAGTAMSLGGGKYLAALPADCVSATLADAPARIATRGKDGLVVLEGPSRPAAALWSAAPNAPADGAPAFALGYFAPQGAPALLFVASGRVNAAGALVAGLQPGMAGAPVFDRDGRFLGLARPFAASRLVAGLAPAAPHALIAAQEATAFAAIAPAPAPKPGAASGASALAQSFRAALAPVTCGR